MICKVCGERINPSMSFCTSCGEPIENNKSNMNNGYKNSNFNEESSYKDNNFNRQNKDYVDDFKIGFNSFIQYFIMILKNPIMDIREIHMYLSNRTALIFTAFLSLIYGLIQCLNIHVMYKGVIVGLNRFLSDITFGYLYDINNFGYYGELPYFKIFIQGLIFILINIGLICIITMLACKIFLRKQVAIIDILKVTLGSLVILNIITLINTLAMAINVKLLIIVSITGLFIYLGTLMFNLAKIFDGHSKKIYIIPTIISLTLIINYYIFVSLIS